MQAHLNKCTAAKQKAKESTESFQELKRQGLLPTVEPLWKRRRLDLVGVSCVFLPPVSMLMQQLAII
jgi:hypothetical protein